MRKPWKSPKQPPKKEGNYIVCLALWGNRIQEELRVQLALYSDNKWSHDFEHYPVIAWAKLPAPPRRPKKFEQ